ncbi:polysaccharide deacetylase family protein [Spirosoma soli]|uniref:Polysaccharide deacetylase family protein n=1 Tax=Spirosoma soli TaxID=1770529 RepID=A0ABW5M8J8_9BACT
MYHRVDQPGNDPWQLSVSPAHFEEHLRILRQKWTPISLAELAQQVVAHSVPDRSVALTFDDGYIDNFNQAKPLLEQFEIPATFFITTQNCQQQIPFWWDELLDILLNAEQLPQTLTLTISEETLNADLNDEATLTPALQRNHQEWTWTETGEPPTRRSRLYLDIWQRLKPLTHSEQQAVMTQLRTQTGQLVSTGSELICMTPDHIKQLINNPLFSIGAHTITHPALTHHSLHEQRVEVNSSRSFLEGLIQKPVSLFAYPYGSYNDTTVAILQKEHFEAAVTTNEGLITKRSQALELNRFQVNDWSGPVFDKQLAQWYRN